MPQSAKTIDDPDIGTVVFRKNDRAKRYRILIRTNRVSVTVPRYGSFRFAEKFFKDCRSDILRKIAQIPKKETPNYDINELRKKAQNFLPDRLRLLAETHHFQYQSVNIRKSKTRWGSCSTKKVINLSLYLMILPEYLIDYVLLHELCHTVEMNHSPAFWALLNQHTGDKAKILRQELRAYSCR